mmetsp:Transcript_45544/g.106495  ORF Transcript_45544/g.106495 Transcript_45544/m.106495 type:complete len:346 (+) Transcript_45544:73-1110(+)
MGDSELREAGGVHVMILSSMKFVEDIVAKRRELQAMGFRVSVPDDTDLMLSNPGLADDLEADLKHVIEQDVLRKGFNLVAAADSVLVLNHAKNGIDGYIGTSVLMELAIAHFSHKPIFLLFPTPSFHEHRWAHEVAMMRTWCLHGDVSRLPCAQQMAKAGEGFDFSFEASEERFRHLLKWSWQSLHSSACALATSDSIAAEMEGRVSTALPGLVNRERDRSRTLARGFQEFPDRVMPARCLATGAIIATNYARLLFGDHGPYLELLHEHICWEHFQEHKLKGPQRHYHEHKAGALQIYEQFRSVQDEPSPPPGQWACDNKRPEGYADYRPGRFYVEADLLEPCGI